MTDIAEQLTKYLTDAHAIEEQALAQLRTAPDIAGDSEFSRIFAEHLAETEEQERIVRARLAAHAISCENRGAAATELPSRVADTAGAPDTAEAARQIRGQELAMSD